MKIITLSMVASSLVMAGAYKVPEQSLNSMALGAAYIAHTEGADTAYFNPANMAFMADKQFVEAGLTWAHLPRNEFVGNQAYSATEVFSANNKSEIENLQLPFLHYVANPINKFRWGASLTVPGGLTKRWASGHQKVSAEEFTLKVIELNPVVSYRVSEQFALGGGLRFIYSEGLVNSDGGAIQPLKREMKGDTIEFGYNLAMSYKPTSDINLAATYRSNIDLKEEGEANLYLSGVGKQFDASVTVPLPAALNLAVSKTWDNKHTLELVYEKTYWSEYKALDFNYGSAIQAQLVDSFDASKPRNWSDTDTFRLGFTSKINDTITLMAGYAKDETPVDKKYVSYELPDSDADIYSIGVRVKANENLSWGVAYLHDKKESFEITAADANANGIIGKFSGGGADLVTVGASYTF
ncbi:MAG: Outer membrane protein assembly factor YaeT precursor [uncultured Sulfurovum sp.]|uniref:Outer membrane protein assembly factor YaeT n=1 Tax=uncultured Sulfurovum sp. TaxID=269237 RepID=A0A6S6T6K0_9BACT|nr:MAG: Outer membrane protein assembly factor YaeT precursor [uncultured Sulfurovum sp.]